MGPTTPTLFYFQLIKERWMRGGNQERGVIMCGAHSSYIILTMVFFFAKVAFKYFFNLPYDEGLRLYHLGASVDAI